MASKLYQQLRADIISSAKAKEMDKVQALRTIDGSIQKASIDENKEIDDEMVVSTLRKAVKDLNAANEQFEKGGRDDLVEKNNWEIDLLEGYLPQLIQGEALDAIVTEAIQSSGATSKKDMGKVMGKLKQHPDSERMNFGQANKIIQSKLD